MKRIVLTLAFIITSYLSFSQNMWGFYYGETYSFGVDLYQNSAKINYVKMDNNDPIDTTYNHNFTSFLPHLKLHYDIASFTEDDLVYFNFTYGISINLSYRINGERSSDNFPVAHFVETGFSYLKGEEYGNAFIGSAAVTFIPAFNEGELFLGPSISLGYQFLWEERLFQVYAKGGLGLLGNVQKNGTVEIDGYSYDANYTYNSNIIGIGVLYRGFN